MINTMYLQQVRSVTAMFPPGMAHDFHLRQKSILLSNFAAGQMQDVRIVRYLALW